MSIDLLHHLLLSDLHYPPQRHCLSGGGGSARRYSASGGSTGHGAGRSVTVTASGTTAGLPVLDTTISSEEGGVASVVGGSGVDTDGDPGEEATLNTDILVEVNVVEDGVGVALLGLDSEDVVDRIQGDVDVAGVVGVSGLNLGDQVLVEEELTNVGNRSAGDSAVAEERSVHGADDVDVSSTAAVVTGEDRLKGSDAVLVGLLETTESHVVKVGDIVAISVAVILHTRVDTGGVAVPDVPPELGDRLAGVDVDELSVHVVHNTGLVIDDVLAVVLALDPERTNLTLGGENAGVVGEESGDIGVRGDVGLSGKVSCVDNGIGIATSKSSGGILSETIQDGPAVESSALEGSASLQLGSAVVERAAGVGQEAALHGAVSDLMLMTRVGKSGDGKTSGGNQGELGEVDHVGRCLRG